MTREQVIVHPKNPYSLPGFEPRTSGFVVWTSADFNIIKNGNSIQLNLKMAVYHFFFALMKAR
jgi:hypothetical protein